MFYQHLDLTSVSWVSKMCQPFWKYNGHVVTWTRSSKGSPLLAVALSLGLLSLFLCVPIISVFVFKLTSKRRFVRHWCFYNDFSLVQYKVSSGDYLIGILIRSILVFLCIKYSLPCHRKTFYNKSNCKRSSAEKSCSMEPLALCYFSN